MNDVLRGTAAESLLSDMGRRMFFPKGIIAQSAEAKKSAGKANGTIGMTVIHGTPAILPSIQESMSNFSPSEIVAYAPTAGFPALREAWKAQMLQKNPSLAQKNISLPVVTPGLTAGLSYIADLFIDETKPLLIPNPSWDNYSLIVETRRGAPLHRFQMFANGALNTDGLAAALKDEARKFGSARLLLNFPQNPSGYSPTHDEVQKITRAVLECAESGAKILVTSDDAYFGLGYESDIEKQSLFAYLADLHENVLAIKADGPTKEDFAWGFRCGFLTFGGKSMTSEMYDALVKKLMGAIRSSVSCSSTPTQSILIHEFKDPKHEEQKAALRAMLEKRYQAVREFVDSHTSKFLEPLPFNSGYFMSFHLNGVNAETLRQTLLAQKGIGAIAIDDETLRVAFSSIDEDNIKDAYQAIYDCAESAGDAL